MPIFHRPYHDTESEFLQLRSLFIEAFSVRQRPLTWLLSRLDNWRYMKPTDTQYPEYYSDTCQVWLDRTKAVVGAFISENNRENINVFTRPGYEVLLPEILSWVQQEWAFGKPRIETEVFQYDQAYQKMLHDHGFTKTDEHLETREYELSEWTLSTSIPLGYTITSVAEAGTVQDKVRVLTQVFAHAHDKITVDVYENWFTAPSYRPELDLLVYTSNGTPVSICTGFIDQTNQIAEIETVGTLPAYQRQGLTKAVITECFQRLQEFDIRKTYISSYSDAVHRVYQSLHPSKVYRKWKYVQEPINGSFST